MRHALRITALALAVVAMALLVRSTPAAAQQMPDLDGMLRWQDAMVLRRYQQTYVTDKRYDALLRKISERLNPHLSQVYTRSKPVRYYVFVGNMGFNAQTWDGLIIFDSLLLDAMRRLCEGVAVYGTTDCDYVRNLAVYVAEVDRACRAGHIALQTTSVDNPYRLPTLWGLTPAQREAADALFEEMLASWMAHEGSHAFLDHSRERIEAQRLLWLYNQQGEAPPDSVKTYISQYLNATTTIQKEREADAYGIRLVLRSGYTVEGLIRSFEFVHYLEQLSGEALRANRTHPTPTERIVHARQISGNEEPDDKEAPPAPRPSPR